MNNNDKIRNAAASQTTAFLYYLFTIIIDQTSFKDNLSLIICKLAQSHLKFFQTFLSDYISFDHICLILHSLTDFREKQV